MPPIVFYCLCAHMVSSLCSQLYCHYHLRQPSASVLIVRRLMHPIHRPSSFVLRPLSSYSYVLHLSQQRVGGGKSLKMRKTAFADICPRRPRKLHMWLVPRGPNDINAASEKHINSKSGIDLSQLRRRLHQKHIQHST